ncbi:MAG: NADH-quinone oxidoreductase subunit L, partial [Verrucomicrobiae bacterium]|nr:NADH-quinone oxidoreductase subunit L [Verrucomicrobiae bacterium]
MDVIPWIILLLPLLAAFGITCTALAPARNALAARLSVGAVAAAFVLTWILRWAGLDREASFVWLQVGGLTVEFGWRLDALSLPMLFVVTGVGGLIHVYSLGYMEGDRGYGRYFAGLSLFTAAMVGIVLSVNLLQMFVFWELVGVSSYLLIGFWHERPAAAEASKKAFLTNRIGDFGFLLGILLV